MSDHPDPIDISTGATRLCAALQLIRSTFTPELFAVRVLTDAGIDAWFGAHADDWVDSVGEQDCPWWHAQAAVREVVAAAAGLDATDLDTTTVSLTELTDCPSEPDPVRVAVFEAEGSLSDIVATTGEVVRSAGQAYLVQRDRGGLDHQRALAAAIAQQRPSARFWECVPRRFLPVGSRVRFDGARTWWTVRAISPNYVALVQQAPFQPAGTMQYTVIDWRRGVRGPCNLIGGGYGDGTYSWSECARMLTAFEYDVTTDPAYLAAGDHALFEPTGEDLEVSHRNNVAIRITQVDTVTAGLAQQSRVGERL